MPKPVGQRRVLGVGLDLDDRVDIYGRPDAAGAGIGDGQTGRAAANEHESVQQRPEQLSGAYE